MRLPPGGRRALRRPAVWALIGGLLLLQGCANTVRTQTLATGVPERPAFALSGPDPETLRTEALRLCAGTGEVVRESFRTQQPPPAQGLLGRWWQAALQVVDPPLREAQLVVRCDLRPDAQRLAALPPLPLPTLQAASPANRRGSKPRAVDADVPYGF